MSSTPTKTKVTEVFKGEQRGNKKGLWGSDKGGTKKRLVEMEHYRREWNGELLKIVWQGGLEQFSLAALCFLKHGG